MNENEFDRDNLPDDYFQIAIDAAVEDDRASGVHPFACSCDFCWYSWDEDYDC